MSDERTSPSSEEVHQPEMAHVMFADIVGYTRLASDEQPKLLVQLRQALRNSAEFNRGRENNSLICISTGDGAALVFAGPDLVDDPIRNREWRFTVAKDLAHPYGSVDGAPAAKVRIEMHEQVAREQRPQH